MISSEQKQAICKDDKAKKNIDKSIDTK